MAGDPEPVVNNWILDYNTYFAWKEFKLDHTLSSSTLDSISGILSKSWEGDEHGTDKKLFLTVLSRLKDGEDINMRYDENSEVTPLEDLVPHFSNLINLQIDDKLLQDGELLLKVIKCEAVHACCRAGEFEKAEEIFDRLFEAKKDKVAKALKGQMKKKKRDTDLSYKDFINATVEYLEQISNSFDEPTIVTAAKLFLERKKCKHVNGKKGKDDVDRIPQREILDGVKENGCNNSSVSRDKQKLRRLWDTKINEMFGSESQPETEEPDAEVDISPPPANRSPSNTSKHRAADSTETTTPLKKPSIADRSPFKRPAPVKTRASAEKASTSRQSSPTPKKARPVTVISPVRKSSVSESSEEDSPSLRYKKNKGRHDRHEPVMSSTRCDVDDNDSDLDVCSVYSLSTKRKWTRDEMLEFYDAVMTIGVGRWAQIKEYLDTSRTNVMLKDKWRNMVKSGDAERIKAERKRKKVA